MEHMLPVLHLWQATSVKSFTLNRCSLEVAQNAS